MPKSRHKKKRANRSSRGKTRKKNTGKRAGKKRRGLPRTIEPAKHQTGSVKNAYLDSKRKALKPGKRISKSGRVYYEYRANRSDLRKT